MLDGISRWHSLCNAVHCKFRGAVIWHKLIRWLRISADFLWWCQRTRTVDSAQGWSWLSNVLSRGKSHKRKKPSCSRLFGWFCFANEWPAYISGIMQNLVPPPDHLSWSWIHVSNFREDSVTEKQESVWNLDLRVHFSCLCTTSFQCDGVLQVLSKSSVLTAVSLSCPITAYLSPSRHPTPILTTIFLPIAQMVKQVAHTAILFLQCTTKIALKDFIRFLQHKINFGRTEAIQNAWCINLIAFYWECATVM